MANCYLLGGFAESTLGRSTTGLLPVWVDVPTLILGGWGAMRLAEDGFNPGPPDGVQLYATGALVPYVGLPGIQLGLQLLRDGITVHLTWYDWRKTHYDAGVALAAVIRQQVTPADPCSIVGHSAGGLVARAAWTELGRTGQHDLVRRIVTLGTPHQGSYQAVLTFLGAAGLLMQVYALNQGIGSADWGALPWLGYRAWSIDELVLLACTWPALYELLPVLDSPDSVSDPLRHELFNASRYQLSRRPAQPWLDWSESQFRPWVLSEASMPPPQVLTCVSGDFQWTESRLDHLNDDGMIGFLATAERGDGIVTLSSAELATGAAVRVTCNHQSLLPATVNSGQLREWILEERSPSPTPPPVEVLTAILTPPLDGPPLPQDPAPGTVPSACLNGQCGC